MSKSISSSKATLSSIKISDTKEPSLDNPVYKVKQLINGAINTIYVFNGRNQKKMKNYLRKYLQKRKDNKSNQKKLLLNFLSNKYILMILLVQLKLKYLMNLKMKLY